ncbi:MAG TPA: benzoate/H(+) symporter BenE family transporter, partial [Baekduia sp.]|nr:benzoate/H(+) symporter BenE family transporter [Baekduia sp.]
MRFQPAIHGAAVALIGFTGAFAIVLAGLRSVGATDAQAASGLLALTVLQGVLAIGLSLRYRMPLLTAWSTPGAALLVAAGTQSGGYPAVVGAFILAGALSVLAGLWPLVTKAIAAIPGPLASGLLAGVLLQVCIAPAQAAVDVPAIALPMIAVWLAATLYSPRWAVPAALAVVVIGVAII